MHRHRWWQLALFATWIATLSATYLYAVLPIQLRSIGIGIGLLAVGLGLVSYRVAAGDPAWWHATLLSAWCAGLVWSFVYGTFSVVGGIIVGMLAVGIGILGYRAVEGPRNRFWRVQLASMLPLGIFLCLHPLADWHNGVPQTSLTIPLGLLFVIVAAWGLWPDGGQPAPSTPQA